MKESGLLDRIIEEYRSHPIDMLGIGDAEGEYNYLRYHRKSYVRTIRDLDRLFQGSVTGKRVLEVGSFLGPVSVALRNLGYQVSALDIPEFHASAPLRAHYERHGIAFRGLNLRGANLPYDDHAFDAVIMCEVLEHLNFNPLPVLKELNRVLEQGGYLYIAMPNQAMIGNRLKLLAGKSIHHPVSCFLDQLDREKNMIVGLHWREYTIEETVAMVETMGFRAVRKYFFIPARPPRGFFIHLLGSLLYTVPSFRPLQVVIGRKDRAPQHDFWLTEANQ